MPRDSAVVVSHTPTPWLVLDSPFTHKVRIGSGNGTDPEKDVAFNLRQSDAAHIVRCVNAHDKLVTALEMVLPIINSSRYEKERTVVRAALSEAGA